MAHAHRKFNKGKCYWQSVRHNCKISSYAACYLKNQFIVTICMEPYFEESDSVYVATFNLEQYKALLLRTLGG